jgi:hypothetical protein
MPDIHAPIFRAPRVVSKGPDGIPDYIVATRGSPYHYAPPPGFKLIIYHHDVRLSHIVEANRKEGWAVGLHYTEDSAGRVTFHPADETGVKQHRFYKGNITFRLERIAFDLVTQ